MNHNSNEITTTNVTTNQTTELNQNSLLNLGTSNSIQKTPERVLPSPCQENSDEPVNWCNCPIL